MERYIFGDHEEDSVLDEEEEQEQEQYLHEEEDEDEEDDRQLGRGEGEGGDDFLERGSAPGSVENAEDADADSAFYECKTGDKERAREGWDRF